MTINPRNSNSGKYTLFSDLLQKEVPFQLILPRNYGDSISNIPVLYLLHGLFGGFDNWLNFTRIVEYADEISFAVVCIEGGNNWYADSPRLENHFYESYLLRELIPAIEENFRVGQDRKKRVIAGLSMGGYGAFKFAFRRPEMFALAASISGAFHAAEVFQDDVWTELQSSIVAVFGDSETIRTENDLFKIVENFPVERLPELPFFRFDCGANDNFLPISARLAKVFERRGIAHEFNVLFGGHDWNYWDSQLENLLAKTENFFSNKS